MPGFIDITANIRPVLAGLNSAQTKQIPFATAKALTALAFDVQRAENAAMGQVFKHPRPFTQRATVVDKATKSHLVATARVKDAQAKYLGPFEFGGLHFVPGQGIAILEPVNIKTDAYGQIRGKPTNIGNRPGVFVGTVNTKRGPVWGFWQRLKGKTGPHLKLLIEAAQALPVQEHLGFVDRARVVVAQRAMATFGTSLAQAVGTSKS